MKINWKYIFQVLLESLVPCAGGVFVGWVLLTIAMGKEHSELEWLISAFCATIVFPYSVAVYAFLNKRKGQ